MKRKARVGQESSIVEYHDKTSETMTEHRILPRATQNKKNGFLIGMRESVVKSETTSWTPRKTPKRVHFQFKFSPDTVTFLPRPERFQTRKHIKSTRGVWPHAMTIFKDSGTS